MFDFFSKEDKQLYNMLGHLNMAEKEISLKDNSETEIYEVAGPDDKYAFLHEAAIIEYHGTLFAAWYNCEEKELIGPTPIRQKRSKDGGKTWSDIETIAEDQTGKILFCPPVYGICEDKLYIGYWNDWYNGLLYLTNTKLFSLQNYLNRILLDIQFMTQSMAGSAEAANALGKMPTITVRMAIAVIGILPLMIIFPFFQSYFARGMTVGAVKG